MVSKLGYFLPLSHLSAAREFITKQTGIATQQLRKFPTNMKRFKYHVVSDTPGQEVWACEACKKDNNELILTGTWKLVDRCNDDSIPCEVCGRTNQRPDQLQ